MTRYDYDFFVIGGGSGGVRAARVAASLGARVAIAENHRYGGTCVIRGCVPKKLLVYAARFADDFADAAGFGWRVGDTAFSWPALIAAKDREIARLSGLYRDTLQRAGVDVREGAARLAGAHAVELGGERITAEHILVATGGRPFRPVLPGIEHAITSNEAFDLPMLPRRVLIVGGGYIAIEFAGIFRGLGAEVALSYRGEEILRGFDDDVRRHLHAEMARRGIDIWLRSEVRGIARLPDGSLKVSLVGTAGGEAVFDTVMMATGRVPNTDGLGLEAAGVALGRHGGIAVDDYQQTSVPGIYAVGDVTQRIALTPAAIKEGAALASSLFGSARVKADLDYVPTAVFSQPPVGTVGLSEAAALERCGEVDVYRAAFLPMRGTLSGREELTLVKLVVDSATQRVLGAHMVGADAPEIVQGLAVAIRLGATKADFDATLGIHPTAAEEFVTLREMITVRRQA
ncbi:MAG: glutathione-disulfide reductase [Betaproteobacteria bacterium HGW-Betaproteobacteria-14]|nr:MAG: glutathione-disulfide reductase [Betaproteobacteria bacterium HGW-Betaproteobacteria-14]